MAAVALDTPLAETLTSTVQSRIVGEGWTSEDDTSLAEYIVLMLANGKTQEQVAAELEGELLQDASGTTEFSQWLFEQLSSLTGTGSSGTQEVDAPVSETDADMMQESEIPAAYETDMGDSAPDNAPRGPRGLHGGRGAARGRGGKTDSVLHRTRGNDRINSHVRGAPKGPRGARGDVRPGMQKALNGMGMGAPTSMPNPMMQNGSQQGQPALQMTPQQQMEFMQMMEQQARMMAQFMQPGMNPAFPNSPTSQSQTSQGSQGRSLFDRIEPGRGRGGRGRGRGGATQNGATRSKDGADGAEGESQAGDSIMDTESVAPSVNNKDPATTMCLWNKKCTNKDCLYVHQSPAAPDGIIVDMNDTCTFGGNCTNPKCVAKHPSPANRKAAAAQEICKFYPYCTNPVCAFKHPDTPLCSFGVSCKNPETCRFTHLDTPCKFNPCTNTRCNFKHAPGQHTGNVHEAFKKATWTAESAPSKSHVSERKFVEDTGEEELIKPEVENAGDEPAAQQEELIT